MDFDLSGPEGDVQSEESHTPIAKIAGIAKIAKIFHRIFPMESEPAGT